jgi:hypothetical protein
MHKIPTQAWRKYQHETLGIQSVVYEDWAQVDAEQGDLLYVGKSTRNLYNRLHPMNHAMWSVLQNHPLAYQVRIVLWLLPRIECTQRENDLIKHCIPLWNHTQRGVDASKMYQWQKPDFILRPDAFDPHQHKSPFKNKVTGVYAWILSPRIKHRNWLRQIMVDSAASRKMQIHAPVPMFPFQCLHCGTRTQQAVLNCGFCGLTETQVSTVILGKAQQSSVYTK